ncbi:hypothetical protein RB201_11125 [Streptomyces sp. S1A(2023)]
MAGPDNEVTFHGERTDGVPLALLVLDGDRPLAGLPDGPGDTATDEEARLSRLVDALSFAPASVLRRAADRPAPAWVMARVRYMTEAVRFEQRLGRYLGGHEAANAQLVVMTRELWDRAVAAGRWRELGSNDPSVDGAVGTGWDQLLAVVESGNARERMGMLWIGSQAPDGQGGVISELLGSPAPNPDVITAEYRSARPPSQTITAHRELSGRPDRTPEEQDRMDRAGRELRTRTRAEDLSPPLSEAERALMPDDGIPWIPGMHRYDIAMDSAPQAEGEERGALVRAATSGSAHRLLSQAVEMRRKWRPGHRPRPGPARPHGGDAAGGAPRHGRDHAGQPTGPRPAAARRRPGAGRPRLHRQLGPLLEDRALDGGGTEAARGRRRTVPRRTRPASLRGRGVVRAG